MFYINYKLHNLQTLHNLHNLHKFHTLHNLNNLIHLNKKILFKIHSNEQRGSGAAGTPMRMDDRRVALTARSAVNASWRGVLFRSHFCLAL